MYGLYIQPEFKIPLISDPVNTEVKYKMAGEIYLTRALRQESYFKDLRMPYKVCKFLEIFMK